MQVERPAFRPNQENVILLCCVVITLLFLIIPASFNNWTGIDCVSEGDSLDFTAGLVGVHADGETKSYDDIIDLLKANQFPGNIISDAKDIRDRAHASLAFVVLACVAVFFVSIATVRVNIHPIIQFVAPFFALVALLCWIAAHVGFNTLTDDVKHVFPFPLSCNVKFHICFIAYFFTVASCCLTALLCKRFVDVRLKEGEGVGQQQEGLLSLPYETLEGTQ